MDIGIGSRVVLNEERSLTETRNCVATVVELIQESLLVNSDAVWLVRYTVEDVYGEKDDRSVAFEIQALTRQMRLVKP